MAATRSLARPRGAVHDVARLKAMSTEACNVVFVSETTLNLIQNFATSEVLFEARYGTEFSGGDYVPISPDDDDYEFVLDVIRRYRLEVVDMTCDLTGAINNLSAVVSVGGGGCGCDVGNDVDTDDGEEGGDLPGDVLGVPYEEPDPIVDRKCLAANYIHMSVRDIVIELNLNRADAYGYAGIVFILSLVSTVVGTVLAGPVGALVGAVIGSFLSMAVLLFRGSFDLDVLEDAILADEDAAVCALFEATVASEARDAYIDHLVVEGATTLEAEFAALLLPNNLVNLLFFAWGDSEEVIDSLVPVSDCSTCEEPESCEVGFIYFFDTEDDMGTGDPTRGGGSRVLTAVKHPSLEFWYIAFKVGLPQNHWNYNSNCDEMPGLCIDEPSEQMTVNITDQGPAIIDSTGTRCVDGVKGAVWSGSPAPTGDQNVSYVEFIGDADFTITLTIV